MNKFSIHSPLHSWKKSEYPLSPFVHLCLGTQHEEDGQLLLSAQLMTEAEVDHAVDELVKEMEELRKPAKEKLRTLKARMLAK